MPVGTATTSKRAQAPSKVGELKRIFKQSQRFIKDGKHINAKTLLEKAIVVHRLDQTHPEFLYLNG